MVEIAMIKITPLKDLAANEASLVTSSFSKTDYQEEIIEIINTEEKLFILQKQALVMGFYYFKVKNSVIFLYYYINACLTEKDVCDFAEHIQYLKNTDKQISYIVIMKKFDSMDLTSLLRDFIKIQDYTIKYCREYRENESKIQFQNKGLTWENEITNYEELIEFHQKCFYQDKPYMSSNWKTQIMNFKEVPHPKITEICRLKGEIIGSCNGLVIGDIKNYLFCMCVHPDHVGKGIGKELILRYLQRCNTNPIYLHVYYSAKPAVALYESVGFKKESITSLIF